MNKDIKSTRGDDKATGSSSGGQQVIANRDMTLGGDWCNIFQTELLERDPTKDHDLDSQSKILSTLAGLRKKYGSDCPANDGLEQWLGAEQKRVKADPDGDWLQVKLEDVDYAFFKSSSI